jgi:phospholipid/cholesterol/gamma-HCH transport system substrate-binding protein
MPSAKRVVWSQLKVGIMAIIALAVLSVLIFLLTGTDNPFAERSVVYTFLNDSAALAEGAGVRLNGILVGKVNRIALSGESNPARTIRMDLEIDQKYMASIPIDSEIGFSAENVLGAKFLNIKRGQSKTHVKHGDEIRGRDDRDFLEVVQSAMPLLDSIRVILARVERIVSQVESGGGSIGKLLVDDELYNRLNRTMIDVENMTHSLAEGRGTLGRLMTDEGLYNDVRQTLGRLDRLSADLQEGKGTAGKLLKDPALYDDLRTATAEVRKLLDDLNAGKGTAGKFLKDEALHNQVVATLDKVNGTIDRLNGGQGTLGQLLVNPALFESLTGSSQELGSLLKDFRANPKKFLTIQLKLF